MASKKARIMGRKFGRRPPKNAPAIKLSRLLTGEIPQHPALADYLNIGGWKMLGNDQYGDCVAVTWSNVRRLMTRLVGAEKYASLSKVLDFYKTQNPDFPNEDNGMDVQTGLEYLVHHGGPDGEKAIAFAKVDHTDADEVKAAIAVFGYLWTGVNVQEANSEQFDAGEPWDYVRGSKKEGSHSIIVGGYDSDAAGGDEKFITWGKETSFTDHFWSRQAEEAWVAIWPEHLTDKQFLAGIDLDTLAADYKKLTGRTFVIQNQPTPKPTPKPRPQPTPPPKPKPKPAPSRGLTISITDRKLAARISKIAAKERKTADAWVMRRLAKYFRK